MNIYKINMKIEDFKELKNFLPPDTPIDVETQQIKTKDFDKSITPSGGIAEDIRKMIVVNIERKVLEEFANDIIKWARDISTKKMNKGIIIDLAGSAYNIRTASDYGSGTITIINKNGTQSDHYNSIKDQHIVIKEAIMNLIQKPSTYPITFPVSVPPL